MSLSSINNSKENTMSYIRTKEILEKQSEAAKKNWENNREKQLESLSKRDMSKAGRKKTFIRFNRKCLICDSEFEIKTTAASVNKKFCSKSCYNIHQKQVCSTDEYKEWARQIFLNVDKSYMQSEEYSKVMSNPNTPEYKKYAGKVHRLTRKVYNENCEIINPNNYPRTVCGIEGGYQLDHIITIKEGFEKGIPPEEIANINNLRMLPWKDNLMRNYGFNI